ncbi:Gfo/Idh/MocA family protein [Nocardia salmonicida]|uniref:Gfo/Idh/MocA family protein n=1 Tax=Nocardia salmonicida TaxID=53431 RepID=UPI000A046DA3|nr:Gfo/Idh/MocA family oxidoreductase [Nocardia salmonicida]MBC7299770.1 Gfo/Idh/MocA family oxidoreductase [Nocardia sp.]
MSTPMRVVLIGAGTRARKLYLPWLNGAFGARVAAAELVAVIDRDQHTLDHDGHRFAGTVAGPADIDQVLVDTEPDLVVIATPDAEHRHFVERALAARCAALVEKPLATTIDDAVALAHAGMQGGAVLLVAHNLRFTNVHTQVHQMLADGLIGTVADAEFHYRLNVSHSASYFQRWHRRRAASGGLEVTKACHHLDLLAWWLHAHPSTVTATLQHRHYKPDDPMLLPGTDIHDTIAADIAYDTGAYARYTLTTNADDEGYTCHLFGTAGTLTIHYDAHAGPHLIDLRPHNGPGARYQIPREPGTHAGADTAMLAALPAAVTDQHSMAFATAADAARAVATGATMHPASLTHHPLPIPDPTTTFGASR